MYTMTLTKEQEEKRKEFNKRLESLEFNKMCYNCKCFGTSCKGEKNKVYSGCIYHEKDTSKPSIYAQIHSEVYGR